MNQVATMNQVAVIWVLGVAVGFLLGFLARGRR